LFKYRVEFGSFSKKTVTKETERYITYIDSISNKLIKEPKNDSVSWVNTEEKAKKEISRSYEDAIKRCEKQIMYFRSKISGQKSK